MKVGDRVLIRRFMAQMYHVHIIAIKNGFFGPKYYAMWTVSSDLFGTYKTTGTFRDWNVLRVDN